jgi:hypothetical protein
MRPCLSYEWPFNAQTPPNRLGLVILTILHLPLAPHTLAFARLHASSCFHVVMPLWWQGSFKAAL